MPFIFGFTYKNGTVISCITISIVNDNILENTESFNVMIGRTSNLD